MPYGNRFLLAELGFPLLGAQCVPHNWIYKEENVEGPLLLVLWNLRSVVLQTHLVSHFVLSVTLKSKGTTHFHRGGSWASHTIQQ